MLYTEACCEDATYQATIASAKAANKDAYDASSCHLDCGPVPHDHGGSAKPVSAATGLRVGMTSVTVMSTILVVALWSQEGF